MKKYSLTILFILLLGLIVSIKTIWAQPAPDYTTIVQDYPLLPACEGNTECRPGQGIFGLPQFVKYIFLFALGVVGVVALLGIIIGAFGYVTSAGNPQKAADSKEKIIAALLGLLLLLGSALILNMINPDLLKLKVVVPEVDVPITNPFQDFTTCHYTGATVAPTTIRAGEMAQFTLHRVNCTLENTQSHRILVDIWQEVPSILQKDLDCRRIVNDSHYFATAESYVLQLTFDEKCYHPLALGVINCYNAMYDGPIICNMRPGDVEKFYVTVTVEIPGKGKVPFRKTYITVIDGE